MDVISRRTFYFGSGAVALCTGFPALAQGWTTYRNPRFGTSIEHPTNFKADPPPQNGAGRSFGNPDRAVFSVWGGHNALDHNIAGFEKFIRDEMTPGKRLTYDARGANWFVLSGVHDANTFYERYILSHGGRIENGFTMQYPTRLQKAYDPIVTRMSRSFRAGRGADTEGNP